MEVAKRHEIELKMKDHEILLHKKEADELRQKMEEQFRELKQLQIEYQIVINRSSGKRNMSSARSRNHSSIKSKSQSPGPSFSKREIAEQIKKLKEYEKMQAQSDLELESKQQQLRQLDKKPSKPNLSQRNGLSDNEY